MKITYDIIIIGGTLEGIFAAKYAVSLGARVALIIPEHYTSELGKDLIIHQLGADLFNINSKVDVFNLFKQRQSLIIEYYLPELEIIGVDIIFSSAKFYQSKKLDLQINKYNLQAPVYLLAMSSQFFHNPIKKQLNHLSLLKYLTINDLINQPDWQKLPNNIVIIGNNINTIALAQKLNKIDKNITIITAEKQLLAFEDKDISFTIQANLEAQGVCILTNKNITQIKLIDGYKWLQAGNKAIQTEEIIVANQYNNYDTNSTILNNITNDLGLKKLGFDLSLGRIIVNNKLQSSHPQIYACGDLLGGYNLPNIAEYEAKIAIKNALILPIHQINYHPQPYLLPTNPSIVRIGYTETQARQIYNDKLNIIKFRYTPQLSNFTQEYSTVLIKIILDDNNYLIGTHFVNIICQELITAFSLTIQQNKKIDFLLSLTFCDIYSLEIINHLYQIWQEQNSEKNRLRRDILETYFIWKRS